MNAPEQPPVWMLDIDGVVLVDKPGWEGQIESRMVTTRDGQRFHLRWAVGLVEHIVALHELGTVELRLCSSWVAEDELLRRTTGLPVMPLAFPATTERRTVRQLNQAKLDAASAVRTAGRRLIWTDDDAIEAAPGGVLQKLRGGADGVDALLIAPDFRCGLTPKDMARITEYAMAYERA